MIPNICASDPFSWLLHFPTGPLTWIFHKHLKLQISTAKLKNLFSPNMSIPSSSVLNCCQKHLHAPNYPSQEIWEKWPHACLFHTNPFSDHVSPHDSANVSDLLSSCLHPYYHSLLLDPHLYRLTSLVSVLSLSLVFSICHQSYVYKSNLI